MPLYRRVPKLKHFPFVNPTDYTVINVSALAALPPGTSVTLASLEKAGIVTNPRYPLKVLGNGTLEVKLTVEAAAFTAGARAKIESVGGTCTVAG